MVQHHPARAGLTLVELILATTLSAMVLVAVFTAVEVQLRAFERGTRRTEQARLAHMLLRRMAADLRGTLGPPSPEQPAIDDSGDDLDLTSFDEPLDVFDPIGEMGWDWGLDGAPSGPIGLRGESDRLRLDVVRAVPGDSDASVMAFRLDGTPSPADSGIRTIEYFVAPPDTSLLTTDSDLGDAAGGLVRREMIEPVAAWALESGMLEEYDPLAPPLAPEVVAVEFRYYDGSGWVDVWDSSSMGSLPRAVEVTLLLASDGLAGSDLAAPSLDLGLSTEADSELYQYRLVVPLPVESSDKSSKDAELDEEDLFADPDAPESDWEVAP